MTDPNADSFKDSPSQSGSDQPQINAEAEAQPIAQEPTAPLLSDRYSSFIEQIITDTLKGKIRSKEFVYDQLAEQLQRGTGEIFERCLVDRIGTIQHQLQAETDELKRAKAERQGRALQTLQDAWEKWKQTQQTQVISKEAVTQLLTVDIEERLAVLLQFLDPNQTNVFSRQHIELLAKGLDQIQADAADAATIAELRNLAIGLKQGLATYTAIESYLVSWLYDNPHNYVGFESKAGVNSPWTHWGRYVDRPLLQALFAGQALNQSAADLARQQGALDLSAWVELIVVLRGMQNGLVTWFDKQPYSRQAGQDLGAATFLAFAVVWCELSNGFQQAQQLLEIDRQRLSRACFQITLQILRAFAQRDNFPLYGGVVASFSGDSLRDTVAYLDQPLKVLEKAQEKARILTLLGYSQQWIGNREKAQIFYEEALEIARQSADRPCEIANLNHLSRLRISQRDFTGAMDYGQRALMFARQVGDFLGEANAIANAGYAEVRQAQQQEYMTVVELEPCIQRLERGLKLAEKQNDWLSQIFCALGLGIAHLILNQSSAAKPYLEKSLEVAIRVGYLELEGLSYAANAEANYQLNQLPLAIVQSCLGMYLLEQKQAIEGRQVANLVAILRGRVGDEAFRQVLQQQRAQLIARIGVEGFEHLLNSLPHS